MKDKTQSPISPVWWVLILLFVVATAGGIMMYMYRRPMTYVIITTCILDDAPDYTLRRAEYFRGIQRVLDNVRNMDRVKVVIVENNHHTSTYLDGLGVDVVYTTNNGFSPYAYKGDNELADVHECIHRYKMNDRDFLVKITGRYMWDSDSPFLRHLVQDLPECIVRFGSYHDKIAPLDPTGDCVTGLIGMRVEHIKKIQYRFEKGESIEMEWAEVARSLPRDQVTILPELGLQISPGGAHQFFRV
jgi:hypothetical protein